MTKTASFPELLQVCLWDLLAGCRDLIDRLPAIASVASDADLRAALTDCVASARERVRSLTATGVPSKGPANLWMAGILDDAERDTRSHQPGHLLDVALIGAVRKALAAELASIATAEAVAASLNDADACDVLSSNEADLQREDAVLATLLAGLADPGMA